MSSRRTIVRRSGAFSLLAAVTVLALAACDTGFDGVLWRQMAGYRNQLSSGMKESIGKDRDDFIADIINDRLLPDYWDGSSKVSGLGLHNGGQVIYNLTQSSDQISFDVLTYSGNRRAPRSGYWGPPAIYTCTVVEVTIKDAIVTDYVPGEPPACEPELVAALNEDARYVPSSELQG